MNTDKVFFTKSTIQTIKLYLFVVSIVNLFTMQLVYAQTDENQVLDSLLQVIEKDIPTKEKIDTYNLIAAQYSPKDSLEILKYTSLVLSLSQKNNYAEGEIGAYTIRGEFYSKIKAIELSKYNHQKALSIAQKNNLIEQEGDVLYNIGNLFKKLGESEQALEKYKQALEKLQKVNSKYKMGDVNYQSGVVYFGKGMYDETAQKWQEALQNKKDADDKQGVASVYNALGVLYDRLNEYDKVLFFYQKSLEIREEIGDIKGMAQNYNNLGKVSQDRGAMIKALEYYQISLDIRKKLNDKKGMSHTYHNIALVHKSQGSYDLAMDYVQKALKINQELNDKNGISYLYTSLGGLYEVKEEYDTALIYYEKSLKIREQLQDKSNIASSYQNFASIHLLLKKYEEALVFANQSMLLRKELGEKAHLAQSYLTLGSIKFEQNKYQEALNYLNESILLAQKAEDPIVVKECADLLAQTHEKLGNYKEAYKNHVLYKKMTDSLSNDENTKRITRLESEYEFKQVEDSLQKTNVLQAIQLEKEEIKNRSQRKINILISSALLVVLILAFFIYRSRQQQKDLNTQLNEQKEVLSLKGTELTTVNDELSMLNEELHQNQEEIIAQRDSIEAQNALLEEQHQEIKYSIRAAQTIQRAILPLEEQMKEYLGDYFIIYRPRDVVSGDFYWLGQVDEKRIIGALDCTGHGVQGAFMSMIGFTLLNKIVNTNKITEPAQILEHLRIEVNQALRQEKIGGNNGMDAVIISLETIDTNQTKVTFAGAKRPLWYIENETSELQELKGNKVSIGIKYKDKKTINSEIVFLATGSMVYLGSDGLSDQNDHNLQKFGTPKLKEIISKNAHLPIKEQGKLIEIALDEHMQDTKQRDDILWMGIKV